MQLKKAKISIRFVEVYEPLQSQPIVMPITATAQLNATSAAMYVLSSELMAELQGFDARC